MDVNRRPPKIGLKSRTPSEDRTLRKTRTSADCASGKPIGPHWEEFFRDSDDPVFAVGADHVCSFANRACARLLGTDTASLSGEKLNEMLVAENGEPLALAIGSTESTAARIRARNETLRRVEISSYPIVEDGERAGWIFRLRDLDACQTRKRMECIGAMASGVAHDLNNVLSPILMGTQILQSSTSPESLEMITRVIESAAQRGAEIVRQMLTCARESRADFVRTEVNQLITEAREQASEVSPRNLRFVGEPPSKPLVVEGDCAQLRLMILCMVQMAADCLANGGDVIIRAEEIVPAPRSSFNPADGERGTYIRFSARPSEEATSGPSVETAQNRFPTTRRGVRLAMIEAVAKNHAGYLAAETPLEFPQVYIPASHRSGPEVNQTDSRKHTVRGETILVIDHEPGLRRVMGAVLEHAGYKPLLAANVAEAGELCARATGKIPLVIADDSSGAAEWVNALQSTAKPRLILVTNKIGTRGKRQLTQSVVEALLMKPYLAEELLGSVQEVLNGTGNNRNPQ